jgi:phosphatase NudJ
MERGGKILILAASERASDLRAVVEDVGLEAIVTSKTTDAIHNLERLDSKIISGVVCALGRGNEDSCWPLLAELRKRSLGKAFVIVLSYTAAQDAKTRLDCFDAGANMVTSSMQSTATALARVATVLNGPGAHNCPKCGLSGLSENSLHLHMHFHHACDPNMRCPCPICGQRVGNMEVHVHNEHGPLEEREPLPASYAVFAWCVCQRPTDGKFLMVNEPAGISGGRPGYWLPAGRVDKGERLVEACRREALEEAGVAVRVTGVLRFMVDGSGTLRVVFLAVPENCDDCEPKGVPDWESVGALWTDVSGLEKLTKKDYRSPDPADLYPKVATGALQPQSLDTEAFRALETLVQRLTAGDRAAEAELPNVWKRIKMTYPPSAFER